MWRRESNPDRVAWALSVAEVEDATIRAGQEVRGKLIVRNQTLRWVSIGSGVPIESVLVESGTHRPVTGCHTYAGVGMSFSLAPGEDWSTRASDLAVRNTCFSKPKPLEPKTYEFVAPLFVDSINGDRRFDGEIWTEPVTIEVLP